MPAQWEDWVRRCQVLPSPKPKARPGTRPKSTPKPRKATSLMPEGGETKIDPQAMADLIAFLRNPSRQWLTDPVTD